MYKRQGINRAAQSSKDAKGLIEKSAETVNASEKEITHELDNLEKLSLIHILY